MIPFNTSNISLEGIRASRFSLQVDPPIGLSLGEIFAVFFVSLGLALILSKTMFEYLQRVRGLDRVNAWREAGAWGLILVCLSVFVIDANAIFGLAAFVFVWFFVFFPKEIKGG